MLQMGKNSFLKLLAANMQLTYLLASMGQNSEYSAV